MVTEFFPHENTSNIIGNYGISCYPYDTIDLEKENINYTEEGEGKTLLYPFYISIITKVWYINKFDDKNLNFLKYKTPFYSLTVEHYVEYLFDRSSQLDVSYGSNNFINLGFNHPEDLTEKLKPFFLLFS